MITNKDIRVENGSLILNGDPYPLDGQSPEAIMKIVKDNSDTTPTENSTAPITSGGVFTALGTKQDKINIIPNTGASYTCTSTNLEYTGVSVTCPAGHTYIVRAALSFSNTAPSEILASKSNTNSNVHNRLAYAESGFATFLLKGGETAYIWGKWGSAGTNSVSYDAIDITN